MQSVSLPRVSPVDTTAKRHGWRLCAEGAMHAVRRIRSSSSRGSERSSNRRTLLRPSSHCSRPSELQAHPITLTRSGRMQIITRTCPAGTGKSSVPWYFRLSSRMCSIAPCSRRSITVPRICT